MALKTYEREFALVAEGQKFVFLGSEKVWMKVADSESVNGPFNGVCIYPGTFEGTTYLFQKKQAVHALMNRYIFTPEVKAL